MTTQTQTRTVKRRGPAPARSKPHDSPRTAELRELIWRSGLTREQAAEALGVGLETLHKWLLPPGARWHVEVPETALRLAKFALPHWR